MGQGAASLGILRPPTRPSLSFFDEHPRLRFRDEGMDLTVALTDIRLVQADQKTLDARAAQRLGERLRAEECLLAVGVGRAWTKPSDDRPRHWLQVNNVHFPTAVDWSA
ncbi:MAG: hypothetical protein QOE90_2270 [Thermoplasmata archaeon]|nr:hypothetical protein [Thermoplasmata archaeon]